MSASSTAKATGKHALNILVLCKGKLPSKSADICSGADSVSVVETFDQALDHLHKNDYDLVVVENSEFFSLQRAALAEQSSVILETIGQGVGILDLSGVLMWSNQHLSQLPEPVRQQITERCLDQFKDEIAGGRADQTGRQFTLHGENQRYYDVTASPVIDADGDLTHLAVVLWDTTDKRSLQHRLDAIDSAGRELVRLESNAVEKLDIPSRLSLLEEKVIAYTEEVLGFDKFSIRLLDGQTNRLDLVLCSGFSEASKQSDVFATCDGNGICGYVAATGRSYICPDVKNDNRYRVGIDNAASSLTVPLHMQDQVIGVFNIESDRQGAFTENDRQFAEIFGRYVAIALHILDLLVIERHDATGQLADTVAGQISSPLNDILTEAKALKDQYIGRDDLAEKLSSICENVEKIRQITKDAAEGKPSLVAHKDKSVAADAVIEARRILVIDDEPIIRQTVSDVLGDVGAVVDKAREGNEAVDLIEANDYDLILSDIKLPNKNGYAIFAAAKEKNPDVPVVFMTGFGYDPNHSIIRARQEGLAAVLYKPFRVNEFLTLIRDVLQEAQAKA